MSQTFPRRQSKVDATLDAAAALFLAEGYAGVSMDAVARGAGISKATLYAYFAGKDALFAAVIGRQCAAMAREATAEAGHGRSLQEGLTRFGVAALTLLLSPASLAVFRTVLTEAARAPGLAQAFHAAGPAQAKAALAEWLAEEQRLGRMDGGADPQRAAMEFHAMLRGELWLRANLGLEKPGAAAIRQNAAAAAETFCRAYSVHP